MLVPDWYAVLVTVNFMFYWSTDELTRWRDPKGGLKTVECSMLC